MAGRFQFGILNALLNLPRIVEAFLTQSSRVTTRSLSLRHTRRDQTRNHIILLIGSFLLYRFLLGGVFIDCAR